MKKLHFKIERSTLMGAHDCAYVNEDDDLTVELMNAVVMSLSTDIEVTISDVTMFLAAWEDPDHWSTDWAEKLECDLDDVEERVTALLVAALEAS